MPAQQGLDPQNRGSAPGGPGNRKPRRGDQQNHRVRCANGAGPKAHKAAPGTATSVRPARPARHPRGGGKKTPKIPFSRDLAPRFWSITRRKAGNSRAGAGRDEEAGPAPGGRSILTRGRAGSPDLLIAGVTAQTGPWVWGVHTRMLSAVGRAVGRLEDGWSCPPVRVASPVTTLWVSA